MNWISIDTVNRPKAFTLTNAVLVPIEPLYTNYNAICIQIQCFYT